MKSRYRNVAFLVELIVNILVFSLSCAILVGLFGTAGNISRRTKEKTLAAGELLSVVETLKARGQEAYDPVYWQDDETLVRHYDAGWNPTENQDAPYVVRVRMTAQDGGAGQLCQMEAVAENAAGEEIYSLDTASYRPYGSEDRVHPHVGVEGGQAA